MLYYLMCAGIAAAVGRLLAWPRNRAAVAVLALLAGLIGGSVLFLGGMSLLGQGLNQGALPAAFGQAFWWSLVGGCAGAFSRRRAPQTPAEYVDMMPAEVKQPRNYTGIFLAAIAIVGVLIAYAASIFSNAR